MESLATAHRPRTFTDLAGQKAVNLVLHRMIETGSIPHALLFAGPRGTGKTTSARIFAAAVNCEHPDPAARPCTHCVSCKSVAAGTSMDLIEIDAASNGLVEDIRSLREQVLYETGGSYRVVVLDEAQSMSTAAFNALLKTIEEPPLNTVFILCTTEPGKILDTVVSRCMPFTFNRIGVPHIIDRLRAIAAAEHLHIEDQLLTAIAERADGGMRDAIMTLDQLSRVGITTYDAYTDLIGDHDSAPSILAHLYTGNTAAAFDLITSQLHRTGDHRGIADSLARTLRDVLVLRSGGTLTSQGKALHRRQALAQRLDPHTTVAALRVLWDLKTRTGHIDDPAVTLDLAIVMLGDTLHHPTPATPTPVVPLTLDQLNTRR